MAAAAKSTKYTTLGTQSCGESNILVEATNIDVDSNIDFSVLDADTVEVVVNSVTAASSSPSVVFSLARYNPATGLYDTLLTSAALTGTGTKRLVFGKDVAPTANVAGQGVVSEKMRLIIDYTGTPATDVLNGVTVAVYSS